MIRLARYGAYYAQQGAKLEFRTGKELSVIGGWLSNFEQSLRVALESKPGALLVVPLEFYKTKGVND